MDHADAERRVGLVYKGRDINTGEWRGYMVCDEHWPVAWVIGCNPRSLRAARQVSDDIDAPLPMDIDAVDLRRGWPPDWVFETALYMLWGDGPRDVERLIEGDDFEFEVWVELVNRRRNVRALGWMGVRPGETDWPTAVTKLERRTPDSPYIPDLGGNRDALASVAAAALVC